MNAASLQRYLHDHIPLSLAMQVSVLNLGPDAVTLGAPLAPNINHRDTVFGGSVSAVAILAAWSLLHARLAATGLATQLVIQRNTMYYDLPIAGSFTARSFLATPADWEPFLKLLRRRGRGRLTVACIIDHDGRTAGRFDGDFVALDRSRSHSG